MGRKCLHYWVLLTGPFLIAAVATGETVDDSHTIVGGVMETSSVVSGVAICLCDAATGMPLQKETYKASEWSWRDGGKTENLAIVLSDAKGNFRFENVPDGKYRLVAQRWMEPFKGVLEKQGSVIQLFGAAEVAVPRPADEGEALVAMRPAGDGIVQFNQDVGNDETFLLVSTSPSEFDPILGFHALGTAYLRNIIGMNRMPRGKTTVMGVPNKPLYAFLFAADNSPGFVIIDVPATTALARVPNEPFIAAWSDGRKTPPAKLAELMKFMAARSLTADAILKFPRLSPANYTAYKERMQELVEQLSKEIDLGDGKTARVGDLLAVHAYEQLQRR